MKTQQKVSLPAMNAAWNNFPWGQFPGGVQVSFALTDGKRLLLVRPTRWNYVMVQVALKPDGVLEGALAEMYAELRKLGVQISGVGTPSVRQVLEESGTYHVLVVVPYTHVSGPSVSMECVNSALMLGGFSVSNQMVRFVPEMLDWPDAYLMAEVEEKDAVAA